ncbi:MAG: FmdB family zinc ribbon protein [Chloroflexota bacterium]|nr:hypothetical protein [Anaerolineales bacterium]MCA9975950.1 hypothetical protein [Anaerolineales bacterium]MCB8967034.1 zinc ribbon domain-containing protein [Ardenticatenaceae bacterium]
MPYYVYVCNACERPSRFFFTFAEYDTAVPTCPHCHSQNLRRRIGRVAVAKSEDTRMDSMLDDSALSGLDEDDPKSIGRFMRKMSREMGEDMGDEFNEVVDRLESGESPDSIEESMPDLAGGGDDLF